MDQMAEKQPWNCQGRQFEDQKPQSAENWPWNCQGRQYESKKKCGSNYQGWQFYGHFFKLPNMAGLPKWQDKEQAGAELCQAQVKLEVKEEAWS